MAVVIQDAFTVGADTDLKNHTPTDVGTGYTEIENTTIAAFWQVNAAADRLHSSGIDSSDRFLYTAQGTYTSAEYDVQIGINNQAGADDPLWLLGRVTDTSNYYGAAFYANVGTDIYIIKNVADTVTDLASADTDFNGNNWAGTTIKFEIRDATKKIFADDGGGMTELLSDPDNAITAVGEAGLALGNIRFATDDVALWRCDDFLVTEAAVGDDLSGSASISSCGNVSHAINQNRRPIAAITGGGTLLTAISSTKSQSMVASGGGNLIDILSKDRPATISLQGGGVLSDAVQSAKSNTFIIAGGGNLTSTKSTSRSVTSQLDGGGNLINIVQTARLQTSILDGGGNLTDIIQSARLNSIALIGGGNVTSVSTLLSRVL